MGEADRVLTIFCAERGLLKAVAKGARKPGNKMSGRSDVLCVNELLLSKGRSFEIITQAQTIQSFSALRSNLLSLSFGLYYAELTACFGSGLHDLSAQYFDFLFESLTRLSNPTLDSLTLCMEFELGLLDLLGYKPELTFCIACRQPLSEYKLSRFNIEYGGIICSDCFQKGRRLTVSELSNNDNFGQEYAELARGVQITPLVWKTLVLRADSQYGLNGLSPLQSRNNAQVQEAAQRLLLSYIEQRAGKRFRSLDLIKQFEDSVYQAGLKPPLN